MSKLESLAIEFGLLDTILMRLGCYPTEQRSLKTSLDIAALRVKKVNSIEVQATIEGQATIQEQVTLVVKRQHVSENKGKINDAI